MRQIEFGFNVSNTIPFSMEVAFAQTHGFSCLQVWYDARGFSLHNSDPRDIFLLQACEIPILIHALLVKQIIELKFPIILHVADRHLENTHEHLTIGDGNIDFKLIFRHILKNFSGRIIFEVPFESEARLKSKQKIEQILQLI